MLSTITATNGFKLQGSLSQSCWKLARRDTPGAGTYDKVVSCEMIEAVGHEHLATYFATINAMLKPGGRAAIQVCHDPWRAQALARISRTIAIALRGSNFWVAYARSR